MINEEELKKLLANEVTHEETSFKVTDGDMRLFSDKSFALGSKLTDLLMDIRTKNNLKKGAVYQFIEHNCQITEGTLKKAITKSDKVSRETLYKLVVGLKMSLEEANEYFGLSMEGPLNEKRAGDYVCICALRDKDDIFSFISEYEYYLKIKISIQGRNDDSSDAK